MKNIATIAVLASMAAGCCHCDKCGGKYFGTDKYGERAHLWTLQGKGGLTMEVTDAGGKINRLLVPDAEGNLLDVTIGHDDVTGWEKTDAYPGAIIGRVGNRIADGKFILDGVEYSIPISDTDHNAALHGGTMGWNEYVWDAKPFVDGDDVGIVFTKEFPDGEMGFPGTVNVAVTYTITPENVWRITYDATTDKATPINLTQHVYFNLDGSKDILNHDLKINASKYLAVDSMLKPLEGDAASVEGTPFDFREFHKVGERINVPDEVLQYGPGYDHNWCIDGEGMRQAAVLKAGRRELEVWSDQPGLQFYAGNFFKDDQKMKDGRTIGYRGYLALETQGYPNTPNRPDFPSVTLRPGEKYHTVTEYRFKGL